MHARAPESLFFLHTTHVILERPKKEAHFSHASGLRSTSAHTIEEFGEGVEKSKKS